MGNRNWGENVSAMWPPLDKAVSCLGIIQSPGNFPPPLVPTPASTHSLPPGPEPIWPAIVPLSDLWPGPVVQPTPPRSSVITNKLEVAPATRKR